MAVRPGSLSRQSAGTLSHDRPYAVERNVRQRTLIAQIAGHETRTMLVGDGITDWHAVPPPPPPLHPQYCTINVAAAPPPRRSTHHTHRSRRRQRRRALSSRSRSLVPPTAAAPVG